MPTNSTRRAATATTAVATVAVVACWLSAGLAPATDAVRGALDPVDFARDYVAARARLEDGRGAPPPDGEVANARARRLGAPPAVLLGAIYYIHPPPAVLPVLALARLPWRDAALAWAALSLLALGWLAFSLLTLATRGRSSGSVPDHGGPTPAHLALVTGGLALWPPVLHCLEKGQWSIALAALLAAGFCALEDGRPRRAGVLFGLAAAFKLTPIVLAGVLLARYRRAAAAMLLTFALAALASVAVGGLAPWRAFLGGAARNATVWAAWIANTASLAGVYARLFGGGPFARPLLDAPALASAAFNVTALVLLGAALYATRIRLEDDDAPAAAPVGSPAFSAVAAAPALSPALVAAWLTFPVLLNPLGWTHVLVILLAPLAIAARDGGPRGRRLALVVFALFCVPRQTLALAAGPLPVSPARGLALGLHAFAALALFVALLAIARGGERSGAAHGFTGRPDRP